VDRVPSGLPPPYHRRYNWPPLRCRLFSPTDFCRVLPRRLRDDDDLPLHGLLAGHPRTGYLCRHRIWLPLHSLCRYSLNLLQHQEVSSNRHRRFRLQSRRHYLSHRLPPPRAKDRIPMGNSRHRIHHAWNAPHSTGGDASAHNACTKAIALRRDSAQGAAIHAVHAGCLLRLHRYLHPFLLHALVRPAKNPWHHSRILGLHHCDSQCGFDSRPYRSKLRCGQDWPAQHDCPLRIDIRSPCVLLDSSREQGRLDRILHPVRVFHWIFRVAPANHDRHALATA